MNLEENHGLDDAYFVSNIQGIIITSQSYICFLLSVRPATEEKRQLQNSSDNLSSIFVINSEEWCGPTLAAHEEHVLESAGHTRMGVAKMW